MFLTKKSIWDEWYIDNKYEEDFDLKQVDWKNKYSLPNKCSDAWYYGYYLELLKLLDDNYNRKTEDSELNE